MGNLCICFKKSAKISTKSKSDEIIFSQIAMPDWKQQIDEEIKVQHFDEFQVGEEEFNQKIEMKNNKYEAVCREKNEIIKEQEKKIENLVKEKLEEVKKFEEGNLKNKELEIECEKANLQLENMKIMHREMLERNQCLQSAMKAFESPKEYKDLVVEMEGLKIQNQQFQSNNGIFLKNNEILSDDLRKCIEKNKSLENELEIIQNEFAQEKITTEKYSKILNTLKYDLLKESEIVNLLNEKKILAKNCEDLSKYYSNLLKETQKGLKGANETYYQDLIRVLETRVNELVDKKL